MLWRWGGGLLGAAWHCSPGLAGAGGRLLHWPAHTVRNTFLQYFEGLDHLRVPSSTVIPWNDRSISYVNAGMNQFKPVFLGEAVRPHARATNSQKCVRVGGKHNDLADVGTDTYHHTFFEMLGSWSFGDYFKEEACRTAWRLLTEVYGLPASSLYVTYFKGDEALGLEADLEVKHIWRSIGVPEERILPFGMKDNFWQMGAYGPCGPCTEIHYDRLARPFAGERVNAGVEDLIELWNIVFIQFERQQDEALRSLGTHFIDTGMGLERLTAVLNNKSSNYDTDLFMPVFSAIQEMSRKPAYSGGFSADNQCLDTMYRVLADHARMVTVCLADGMFPQECGNLKHIIKRSFSIGYKHFGFSRGQGSLKKLAGVVAGTLGEAYPELLTQLPRVNAILEHEEQAFYDTLEDVSRDWKKLVSKRPELANITNYNVTNIGDGIKDTLRHIKKWKDQGNTIPGAAAHRLYVSYGFSTTLIQELAQVYGLAVDVEGLEEAMDTAGRRSREGHIKAHYGVDRHREGELLEQLQASALPLTDDSAKYRYSVSALGEYEFPPVETNILVLLVNGRRVEKAEGIGSVGIVLEATNFYHEAGGQEGDTGRLETNNGVEVKVHAVDSMAGYLVHWGTLQQGAVLATGDRVVARICEERRLRCMRNHTATHLLNSVMRALTGLSFQTSSKVTPDYFMLQLYTYQALSPAVLAQAQHLMKTWLSQGRPIQRRTITFQELLQEDNVTLLPGEEYPGTVHVISAARQDDVQQDGTGSLLVSAEPCCGTHLLNTAHVGSFVIENVETKHQTKAGHSLSSICGLSGEEAVKAESNGAAALERLAEWQHLLKGALTAGAKKRLMELEKDIGEWHTSVCQQVLPHLVRCNISEAMDEFSRILKDSKQTIRVDANAEMASEVRDILVKQPTGPIVHLAETDFGTCRPKLRQATKVARGRPILLLLKAKGIIIGRCTLPEEFVELGASTQEWLGCVQECLGGTVATPVDKTKEQAANFKSPELPLPCLEERLQEALEASSRYIERFYVGTGKQVK